MPDIKDHIRETYLYFLEGHVFAQDADVDRDRALLDALCKALIKKGVVTPKAITKQLDIIAADPKSDGLLREDIREVQSQVHSWGRKRNSTSDNKSGHLLDKRGRRKTNRN
jgi:hypothetical protein